MNDKEIYLEAVNKFGTTPTSKTVEFCVMEARQDERKKLEAENLKLHMKIGFLEGQIDFLKGKDSELKARWEKLKEFSCYECFKKMYELEKEKGGEVPTGIRDAIGDVVPDSFKNQELGTPKPTKKEREKR